MDTSTGLRFSLHLGAEPGPSIDDSMSDALPNQSADFAVIDFKMEETLSAPFRLVIDFASQRHDLAPADWLDRAVTLSVWQDGQALRRFHGIVSEFAQGDRGHRRTRYSLVVRPALWRLSLRHNSRIFQHVSPLTIIHTLLAERGITDAVFAVTREPAEREYCVQYRETDLAFLERLAAEEGLFYFHLFEGKGEDTVGGTHRLVFADAPQGLAALGPRTYHSRAGGSAPTRHLRRWRQTARVRPSSAQLKDYSFKQPAYSQLHTQLYNPSAEGLNEYAQCGVVDQGYEHYDYPGRYKTDASGQAFTRVRLEHLRRDAVTAEAESDLPELCPGTTFTLTDHDNAALNRDWQVLGVIHEGQQPQALEEDGFHQGGQPGLQGRAGSEAMTRYANTLTLAPGDRAWRPAPTPKPRVDGPQVAFVVGPEGEEIYCDPHGRVKVQFPWDRYAKGDTAGASGNAAEGASSAWLRVSQGWAGGGYGVMAIPRIGHEVIVSFLEGDPDQPLITGRTYHAVNTPPYPLPEHKTRTVIRTQSHKGEGFNELRFEDEKDREQIWVHAQRDLELITEHDRTEEIRNDSFLSVKRDRLEEIDRDTHLTVHGERREKIDTTHSLTVNGSLHLKAGKAWLSESGRELHIKAGQQIVLEAGDELTLAAGGNFLTLDASGVTIVGSNVRINAGGSASSGSGQAAETPRLPGQATPEQHSAITPVTHEQLLQAALQAAAVVEVCQIRDTARMGGPDNCNLGEQCRCQT
ncbi:type VI secretion system Vgr family protein [Modicisalibacter xianhensis]|uniref:Type VI secretion system secreted protein VgrG n=1 Tax=Modicisalibacter xianhensis TaxID=442341 RepID=A0A1I3F5Y0_9GAMM|nr:type VI secretion system tip protein VgrG [Halomonas xianhensis]SFI06181.1 type VI secretion system secreted protein VgrG [Halomonas xianhensis]